MRSLSLRCGTLVLGIVYTLGIFGCGSGRPTLAPVNGEVRYKGKPLETGQITFFPEEGRSASGEIVKGEIVNVTTFERNDGVPVGSHKVTIVAFDGPLNDMYAKRTLAVPKKYTELNTTDLRAEIAASKAGTDVNFDLTD